MPTNTVQDVVRTYWYESKKTCEQPGLPIPAQVAIVVARVKVTKDTRSSRPIFSIYEEKNGDTSMIIEKRFGNTSQTSGKNYCGPEGYVDGSADGDLLYQKTADNQACVSAAFAKLTGSRINLGTSFAEFDKVLQMVAKRLNQAAELFSAMRKADQVRLNNVLDAILSGSAPEAGLNSYDRYVRLVRTPPEKRLAGMFLEYAYGWRPLMQDIYDGLEALNSATTTRGAKIRVTAGLTPGMKKTMKPPGWTPQITDVRKGPNYCDRPSSKSLEDFRDPSSVVNYCVVNAIVVNPTLRALNEYGLVNPAQVLWERVPYSFVVDWFLGVQDALGAMTSLMGLRLRGASFIWERRVVRQFKSKFVSRVDQTIYRTPVSMSLAAIPRWKLGWLLDPSLDRIAKASALFALSSNAAKVNRRYSATRLKSS